MKNILITILLFATGALLSLQAQNCLDYEDKFILGTSNCGGTLPTLYGTDEGTLVSYTTQFTTNGGNNGPCTSQLQAVDKTLYYDFQLLMNGSYTTVATTSKYVNGLSSTQALTTQDVPSNLAQGEYRVELRVKYHIWTGNSSANVTVKKEDANGNVTTINSNLPFNSQPNTHWRITDISTIDYLVCFNYVPCPTISIDINSKYRRALANINYGQAGGATPIWYEWEVSKGINSTIVYSYSGPSQPYVHIPCGEHTYELIIYFSNGCILSTTRTFLLYYCAITPKKTMGRFANPTFSESEIKLYPNPASSYLKVDISSDDQLEGELQVVSLTGQVVKKFALSGELENTRLSVAELTDGVYFAHIVLDGQIIKSEKIMIRH